jgi:hypothetical protein
MRNTAEYEAYLTNPLEDRYHEEPTPTCDECGEPHDEQPWCGECGCCLDCCKGATSDCEPKTRKKILMLEDVLAGVGPIVEADPGFTYPQQRDDDERCSCVLDYELGEQYEYGKCDWHLDDENTCRYVKNDGAPACVLGHYFLNVLGVPDLANFEVKEPLKVLDAHGYEADGSAVHFLNVIQSQQDHGNTWDAAYRIAVRSAEEYALRKDPPA